jgi:CelD/BcsL family acetyltransferase involved in cellulose biosynthesis
VVARDGAALATLATRMIESLNSLGCPWTLRLRQLPVGSPLATALVAQLPATAVRTGVPRPVLQFADDRPARRWLSRNTSAALAKARNRIRREGHELEVGWVRPWDEIEYVLPEVVSIHRARDRELRGSSLLDNAQQAQFYHQVIESHGDHWRLLAVRIDRSLAAYALCLMDGDTLHVWDNKVAPHWRRYSAGLIANAEVVLSAAADGSVGTVDWGCGEQRYKTSLSSEVIDAQDLTAWSSPTLRAALGWRNRVAHEATRRPRSRRFTSQASLAAP